MFIFVFSGCSDLQNNSDSQKSLIVEKDGIELQVDLDKTTYSETDTITITATAYNKRDKTYKYTTSNGCDTGFSFNTNATVKRLLDVKSEKVDGQNVNHVCTMAIGSETLNPKSKKVMEIVLSPKKFIEDKKMYKDEKVMIDINFQGRKVTFDLPIKFEKVEAHRNIPKNAKSAAEYFKNNEVLQKWVQSKGFEMSKMLVRETREQHDSWLITYRVPTDGAQYKTKRDGKQFFVDRGYLELEIESDTAKIIEAKYINESNLEKSEVIIPHMVLRTQFENELKANPDKTYRVSVHSNDFKKKMKKEISDDNQKTINEKHINNIKKYNGKVLDQIDSIYTYDVDMKGEDILRMSQDKEWEYIMRSYKN